MGWGGVRVKFLPIGAAHQVYARELHQKMLDVGLRTELDDQNETLAKKIRLGKTEKVPYLVVIGDEEVKTKKLTIESRDRGKLAKIPPDQLIADLLTEIKERK